MLRFPKISVGLALALGLAATAAYGQTPAKTRIPPAAGNAAQAEGDLAAAYGAATLTSAAAAPKAPVVAPVAPKAPTRPVPQIHTRTASAARPVARLAAKQTPHNASHLVTLGLIDGESTDKLSLITLRLDRAPGWKGLAEIQDHGSFLQLTLPGTIVPEPGRFFEGGNPYLPKIAAFQLTPSDAGVRFFASKDAAKIKQALGVEVLGDRIVVSIDHAKLQGLLAAAGEAAAVASAPARAVVGGAKTLAASASGQGAAAVGATGGAGAQPPQSVTLSAQGGVGAQPPQEKTSFSTQQMATSAAPAGSALAALQAEAPTPDTITATGSGDAQAHAEAIIAKTEVHSDIPAPASQLRPEAEAAPGAEKAGKGLDLREKLVKVTVFSAALLGLLGLTFVLKPYLRRRAAAKGAPVEDFAMKQIASLALAPKQRVSVIQVGDERILIGVTPDAVTFLTTLGRSPAGAAPASFQSMLSNVDPRTVELRQPVLKDIPGNDPATLAAPKRRAILPSARTEARAEARAETRPEARAEAPRAEAPQAAARRVPTPHGSPVKPKKPAPSRINIAVGEDGIQDLGTADGPSFAASPAPAADGGRASDDVTRLIREKLKTLRTI